MSRTTVEEIKARIPIEDLIGSYVKIDRAGKSFKAKCPFHNEKSASFFISPERGGYYCFGCGAKGDIFNFVEQFEGLDFKGALKVLADKAGVPLVMDQKDESERDQLFRIMEDAAKYFEDQYAKSKDAEQYVKGRGIKDETRKTFRIGWAPLGWSNLLDYLKKKGWNQTVMEKAGLIKRKEDLVGYGVVSQGRGLGLVGASADIGKPTTYPTIRYYDRFRGRIMFPISDSSGRIVAFTGRILISDDKSAKYLNSPDTPLYDKSAILFGLDKSKTEIRRLNYSIMVEGQMDLIMSYQAGVRNIVAASGTALSDDSVNKQGIVNNLGLVRRLSPNVIMAFDSDSAGRKAAFRAAGIALSLGMDVKMADIVGGKDPADLVKENPDVWKDILRATKPVVEFEFLNVLRDEKDARKLPRALRERVFPLLASIDSRTDQDYFVKMIADKSNIDAGAIWEDLRTVRKKLETEAQAAANTGSAGPTSTGSKNLPDQKASAPRGEFGSYLNKQNHNDLVERRMFGLLNLIKKQDEGKYKEYYARIEKLAGDTFKARIERISKDIDDMSFEAESLYGSDHGKWDVHMKELVFNFSIDVVNEELIKAMQELKIAEKAGDQVRVVELAKKCQILSIHKAEIVKNNK
ncbi:MAG: CHC2 zinc finger domain-containing protein [Candidatus Taylorbacteria bacterium]